MVYYIDSYYERMEDLNYLGYTKNVLFKNSDLYKMCIRDSYKGTSENIADGFTWDISAEEDKNNEGKGPFRGWYGWRCV